MVREGKLSDAGGWGAADTVLISRKPFSAEDLARARDAILRSGFETIYLPDESIANPFTELLRTRDVAAFERQLSLQHPPRHRRPAVLLLYRAGPRPLGLPRPLPPRRSAGHEPGRFRSQHVRAGHVRPAGGQPDRGGGDPGLAAAAAGRAPASRWAPADVPALLRLHRRRLHPDRNRADPEIRPVPGAPDLRAHGHHLLDDDCQRLWQFHEPPAGRALGFPPGRRDGRGGGLRGTAGSGVRGR